jgi:hypothetical protein
MNCAVIRPIVLSIEMSSVPSLAPNGLRRQHLRRPVPGGETADSVCGKMALYGILSILVLMFCSSLRAGVINARTPSLGDVLTAIQSAADGDTVLIPAGIGTWSSQLTITKNIQLIGAGSANTIIRDDIITNRGTSRLIATNPRGDGPNATTPAVRISGFTFTNGPTSKVTGTKSTIHFSGTSTPTQNPTVIGEARIRLDHCKFDGSLVTGWPVLFNDVIGVVDHVERAGKNQFAQIYMNRWGGKDSGNGSWAEDAYWGTNKFLFFEDCRFECTGTGVLYGIDGYAGARAVFRHCTWWNAEPNAHGTESGYERGTRAMEIYNNYIYSPNNGQKGSQQRSGNVLSYNNRYVNYSMGRGLKVYALNSGASWHMSNGQRPWDLNDASTGLCASGTISSKSDLILTDSSKAWTPGQFDGKSTGVVYVLLDLDAAKTDNGDFLQGWISTNGSKTITLGEKFAATSNATTNFAAPGHRYQIWKVKVSVDQTGQGKGALLTGGGPSARIVSGAKLDNGADRPLPYPANFQDYPQRGYPLEPSYCWNDINLSGGAGANAPIKLHASQPQIKEGRDYFTNGSRPGGYPWNATAASTAGCPKSAVPSATATPVPVTGLGGYTYPHPLVTGQSAPAPSPPSNLQVVPGG